jgi:hypothetical protein
MKRVLCLALVVSFAAPGAAGAEDGVAYPEGYREWMHVKSMVIETGHSLYEAFGGIHHLYANAEALEGYRSGAFPDGAVIVFDLLEAKSADAAIVEGPRKVLGVMERNAAKYVATGGWGFEGFAGGDATRRAVGAEAKAKCFDCHQADAGADFVFSELRE